MEKKQAKVVYIDTDSLVSDIQDETVQALVCQICLGIVYHPVECQQCETLFCQAQIATLNGLCPLCKSSKWKTTEYIHRSYKQRILSLQFKCPSEHCQLNKEKLSYDKYIKHVDECQFVIFKPRPEHDLLKIKLAEGEGTKKFYQFMYGDGLTHKPYSEPDNISLNLNFFAKTKSFDLGPYTINMELKEQLNKLTKNKRPIRIDQVTDHKHKFWWIAQIQTNQFCVYDMKVQNGIETTYRLFVKNHKPITYKFRYLNKELLIDFEKMTQSNVKTNKSRGISRILI